MSNSFYLSAWVTKGSQTVTLGTLPIGAYVIRSSIHCTTAFDSDGTDNISIGYTGTTTAYATATQVGTTGLKTVTNGANIGYQSVSKVVSAYYTTNGSAPTVGKCICVLEYFLTDPIPSA